MNNLCINCKHCRANTYGSYGSTIKYNCYNPWVIKSKVDGEERIRTCELERSKIGNCGPDSLFYEEIDKAEKIKKFANLNSRIVDYSLW